MSIESLNLVIMLAFIAVWLMVGQFAIIRS
jgi:hypothetical protein